MKTHHRDHIILAASHFDAPTRDGELLEIDGQDGEPPYLVRWADGQLCPESDLVLEVADTEGPTALAKVILLSEARASRRKSSRTGAPPRGQQRPVRRPQVVGSRVPFSSEL